MGQTRQTHTNYSTPFEGKIKVAEKLSIFQGDHRHGRPRRVGQTDTLAKLIFPWCGSREVQLLNLSARHGREHNNTMHMHAFGLWCIQNGKFCGRDTTIVVWYFAA